jgi:hypothetical protein
MVALAEILSDPSELAEFQADKRMHGNSNQLANLIILAN